MQHQLLAIPIRMLSNTLSDTVGMNRDAYILRDDPLLDVTAKFTSYNSKFISEKYYALYNDLVLVVYLTFADVTSGSYLYYYRFLMVDSLKPGKGSVLAFIRFLRIPEINNSKNYHNVIEHLKKFRGLPRIHICRKALYPRKAILDWMEKETDVG